MNTMAFIQDSISVYVRAMHPEQATYIENLQIMNIA